MMFQQQKPVPAQQPFQEPSAAMVSQHTMALVLGSSSSNWDSRAWVAHTKVNQSFLASAA
jgi:hypothetical protein